MIAGLTGNYDLLFTLGWSFSGEQSSSANAVINGASLATEYANTYYEWTTGISIGVKANTAAPGSPYPTAQTVLTVIFNGTPTTYNLGGYVASGTVTAELLNVKLYSKGSSAGWLLTFDSLTIKYGATVLETLTDGSVTSAFFAPCGVPLFGFPAMLACSGGAGQAPIVGSAPIYSTSFTEVQTAASSATGGWEIRVAGTSTYSALPVTLQYQTPPVCSSYAPDPNAPIPVATDTGSASVSASYYASTVAVANTSTTVTVTDANCGVMLIPDLTKSVTRLNPNGSACMVYRAEFPQSTGTVSSTNTDLLLSNNLCNNISTFVMNPTESDFLGTVRDAVHPIEDVFSKHSYSIYNSSGISWKAYGTPSGVQKAEELSVSSAFIGIRDEDWTGNYFQPMTFEVPPSVDVYGAYGKYLNVWCAPHWNLWPYFPPDSEDDANSWTLDGITVAPSDYWIPARTQWLHNSALPPSEGTNSRTDLISASLLSQSAGLWQAGGAWGITNFIAQGITPSSFTYTSSSSSLFSVTNGTPSFGTRGITITPAHVGFVTITVDLSSFSEPPYFLGEIVNTIAAGWSGGDASGGSVKVTGIDGSTHTLPALGTGVHTYNLWNVTAPGGSHYAGSWGQDFGLGITTDTGIDVPTGGMSASEMSSDTNVSAMQFIQARTAVSVTFTVVVGSVAPFTFYYPTLNPPSLDPIFLSETGMTGDVIYPNGPQTRLGQWNWVSGGSISTVPSIYSFGDNANVIDGIATKHCIYLGNDPVANTNAELPVLYDSTEGNTIADVKHGTYSFFIVNSGNLILILVNGIGEAPPCASWPAVTRDPLTLQLNNGFGQVSYDYSCEPRYLIYPELTTDLFQPGSQDVQWTTGSARSQAGWAIRQHTHAVTNSEDASFYIKLQGTVFATVSPWHGYTWVGGTSSGGGGDILCDPYGGWYSVYTSSGDIYSQFSYPNGTSWLFSLKSLSGPGWSAPRLALDGRSRLILVVTYTGSTYSPGTYILYSDDQGRTWTSPELVLASATQSDVKVSTSGTIFQVNFVPNAGTSGPGTFQGSVRYAGSTSFSSLFTLTDGTNNLASDGSGFGIDWSFDSQERLVLSFVVNGETSASTWFSCDDGKTWQRF